MIPRRRLLVLPLCVGIILGSGITFIVLHLQSNCNDTFHVTREPRNYCTRDPNRFLTISGDSIQTKNKTEVEKGFNEVRVLCWIMTGTANHQTRAIHVRNTWGQRCDQLLFISSTTDDELGTIVFPNIGEGRDSLYMKTRQAFKYIYENHFHDADWFFKADDDTYTVVENLRMFLKDYDTSDPIYFGTRVIKPGTQEQVSEEAETQVYMSGGAGYVLSKEALRRFVEFGLIDSTLCPISTGSEDMEIGKCLENLEVQAGDTRDRFGRNRFLPLNPEKHLIPGNSDQEQWYAQCSYYEQVQGPECCSDDAITFHYIPPAQMYVMDYLIYRLKPHFNPTNSSLTRKYKTRQSMEILRQLKQ